jgi:hypothetical protein
MTGISVTTKHGKNVEQVKNIKVRLKRSDSGVDKLRYPIRGRRLVDIITSALDWTSSALLP